MTSKFGCIGQRSWVKPVQLTASDLAAAADDVRQDSAKKAAQPDDRKRRSGSGKLWVFHRSSRGSQGAISDQGSVGLSDDVPDVHKAPAAVAGVTGAGAGVPGSNGSDSRERVRRARSLWQKLTR